MSLLEVISVYCILLEVIFYHCLQKMTGTKLAATAVLLLLFWNTHQAHAQGLNNHLDHTEKRVVWEYRLALGPTGSGEILKIHDHVQF